jgi:hypothetical protein
MCDAVDVISTKKIAGYAHPLCAAVLIQVPDSPSYPDPIWVQAAIPDNSRVSFVSNRQHPDFSSTCSRAELLALPAATTGACLQQLREVRSQQGYWLQLLSSCIRHVLANMQT